MHKRYADIIVNFTQYSGVHLYSLDFVFARNKFRVFAICAPHADFPFRDFHDLMSLLTELAISAKKDGFIVIIGGDFNCQLDIGSRGEILRELSAICHLRIANEIHGDMTIEDHWTFESSMGIRRQLDFILCSARIPLLSTHSDRAIDMGSDHRAVKCIFKIGVPSRQKKRRRRVRGWKPDDVEAYHRNLNVALRDCKSTASISTAIATSAATCTSAMSHPKHKPWLTSRFHELLGMRRSERCNSERARLSKSISRELRCGLRS